MAQIWYLAQCNQSEYISQTTILVTNGMRTVCEKAAKCNLLQDLGNGDYRVCGMRDRLDEIEKLSRNQSLKGKISANRRRQNSTAGQPPVENSERKISTAGQPGPVEPPVSVLVSGLVPSPSGREEKKEKEKKIKKRKKKENEADTPPDLSHPEPSLPGGELWSPAIAVEPPSEYEWPNNVQKHLEPKLEGVKEPILALVTVDPVTLKLEPPKSLPWGVWEHYRDQFELRYGTKPAINPKAALGMCKNILTALGGDYDEARGIITHYLQRKDQWYLKHAHNLPTLVGALQKLRVEFKSGHIITDSKMRELARLEHNENAGEMAVKSLAAGAPTFLEEMDAILDEYRDGRLPETGTDGLSIDLQIRTH